MPLPFMFTPHEDTTGKIVKGLFFKIQRTWISYKTIEIMVCHVLQKLFELFPLILSKSQASFKKYPDSYVKIMFKLLPST